MEASQEHTGDYEVFDEMWAETALFYHEGDVKGCKNFPELWENVKFRRVDHFFPHTPQKALEIGCGTANVSLYLQNKYDYDLTLVDLSDQALALARKNFETNASHPDWQQKTTFDKADALALPYEDESFDVVMSFGLVEHFTDIETPIAEHLRVLKSGGLLWLDIVPRRFSVETFSHIPGMLKKAAKSLLRGDFKGMLKATEADFYENDYSFDYYIEVTEKFGGKVEHALGNRPYTSFGNLPIISPVMLSFYKTRMAQELWRRFDFSGSDFARWFGAGWWLIATKI